MSEPIGGKPYWNIVFDKEGDVDRATVETVVREAGEAGLTDLVFFSHGWNNDRRVADRLYHAWFDLLAPQLRDGATRKAGLVGLFWPSARWSDEPIPDFEPAAGPSHTEGGAALQQRTTVSAGDPELDPADVAQLESMFPEGAPQLHRIAELLSAPPDPDAVDELFLQLRSFAENTAGGFDDGESDGAVMPGMLAADNDPRTVFDDFVVALSDCGVEFDSDEVGGAAGLGDMVRTVWNGAKEALRQLTYYEMKNRAGVVGQRGLGPLIGELHDRLPGLRVHLVGHSFGGRVVSFALAGLPEHLDPSPVKSVTLLQPAFSAFAFADRLPFDSGRSGALAGRAARVDGPISVCYSSHDSALGVLYPIASAVSRSDAAAAEDARSRWSALGAVGAHATPMVTLGKVDSDYPFDAGHLLNIDASEIVKAGRPPSGAHSDIVHEELAWVVARAGGLAGR
ncbi:serine-threonine protein kinase [Rhodococcus sp. NPDC003348]